MAATGPGLGAYIQAQKRQKQIEDQLAHANKDETGKDGAKKEDGDKKDDKEEQNTVSSIVKSAAQEVIATVKAVTTPEDPNVTMDGSVARIVQFSDSDDDEPKLKPRPAPQLPPKQPRQDQKQRLEHRNLLGKRVAEGIGGLGQWAQGMRHAPLQLSTGQRGVRRVQTLWHERAVPQMRQAYSGITLGFVVKLALLWLLRRRAPRALPFLEFTSLAIPLTEALARWQMPDRKFPDMPRLAVQGLQAVRSVWVPLTVLELASALHQRLKPPERPKHGPLLPEPGGSGSEGRAPLERRGASPSRATLTEQAAQSRP